MKIALPLAATLLALIACAASHADDDSQKKDSLQGLSAPGGTASTGPSFVNSASIEAGTSDTKATLALSGYTPTAPIGDYFQYQVGGSAPITSKGSTDEVDIGTVSGLTAGSSANAQVSAMWWQHQSRDLQTKLDAVCMNAFTKLFIGGKITQDMGYLSGEDTGCDRSLFSADKLKKIESGFNDTIKQCTDYDAEKKKAAAAKTAPPKDLPDDVMARCTGMQTTPGRRQLLLPPYCLIWHCYRSCLT